MGKCSYMKLLVLTEKVDENDDRIGFFHGWILEFAKQVEQVAVLSRQKGAYDFPENVRILQFRSLPHLFRLVFREQKDYDAVFVHECKRYLFAGALAWLLFQRRVGFWNQKENSFRILGARERIVGQGIDTDTFRPASGRAVREIFDIVSVGTPDRAHDFETLLAAAKTLHGWGKRFSMRIFGVAHTAEEDRRLRRLEKLIGESDLSEQVEFQGSVPNKELSRYVRGSDLFIGVSNTGTMSRSALEAMACAVPVLTCNETVVKSFGGYASALHYKRGDSLLLAEKISWAMGLSRREREMVGRDMRDIILKRYDLSDIIGKILAAYRKV